MRTRTLAGSCCKTTTQTAMVPVKGSWRYSPIILLKSLEDAAHTTFRSQQDFGKVCFRPRADFGGT